jgi:hypothetical protein
LRTKVEDHAHLHILILRESRLKTVHGSGSRKRGFTKSARESLASPPRRPATRALWALADAAFGHSEAACDERARAHAGDLCALRTTETGTRFALHFGNTEMGRHATAPVKPQSLFVGASAAHAALGCIETL